MHRASKTYILNWRSWGVQPGCSETSRLRSRVQSGSPSCAGTSSAPPRASPHYFHCLRCPEHGAQIFEVTNGINEQQTGSTIWFELGKRYWWISEKGPQGKTFSLSHPHPFNLTISILFPQDVLYNSNFAIKLNICVKDRIVFLCLEVGWGGRLISKSKICKSAFFNGNWALF